jgi:hypothetical protein
MGDTGLGIGEMSDGVVSDEGWGCGIWEIWEAGGWMN